VKEHILGLALLIHAQALDALLHPLTLTECLMQLFAYHPAIINKFPNLRAAVILADGITNAFSPPGLVEKFQAEQEVAIVRIGSTSLSELPQLAAWRTAFRNFGVNPTKYRSAPEALLRRLTKKGDIPGINSLVDICNLVSIRYGLPVASFDTRALSSGITVNFSDGSERYTPLGQKVFEHPEPGEVIFSDDSGLVVARRWCWRQSNESATRIDTLKAIITIESQHSDPLYDIASAREDILALLEQYIPGNYQSGLLDSDQTSFSS
jgi:DNA/RNA-binding domain of Phe-tRNA-synthetase-like protein